MSLFNFFWRKPKTSEKKTESMDLSKLENHFVLQVGTQRCDLCKKETNNCCKIDIADQCICLAPRKDIRGFYRPKQS